MTISIDGHALEGKRTGVGRYLYNLIHQWTKLNLDLRFILYFRERIFEDFLRSKNLTCKLLKSKSTALFTHYLLFKEIKRERPEIFFSPSYVLPLKVPKQTKTAVTVHDVSFVSHPEWFSWQNRFLLSFIAKKSAQKTKLIFVPSEFTKNEILKYYRVNPDKILVIPLAAEEKFKPVNFDLTIFKKYGINKKFIFYNGAIFNRRHIPECIKAFVMVANKFPEYQFLISGINYTRPFIDINLLVKRFNSELKRKAILYFEYVAEEDLVSLYNAADLFIWLSIYEGFGLPPIEAMACGTPVITSSFGSLKEVTDDAVFFVKDPQNVEEIGTAIEKVLIDKKIREELKEKGLKQAAKFSWEKTAKETLDALLNL